MSQDELSRRRFLQTSAAIAGAAALAGVGACAPKLMPSAAAAPVVKRTAVAQGVAGGPIGQFSDGHHLAGIGRFSMPRGLGSAP